jgi:hypothetical protein
MLNIFQLRAVRRRLGAIPRWKRVLVAGVLGALLVTPFEARGQFGLDPCCAIISAGLNTISGLLKNAVAQPLGQIQQLRQQAADFQKQVIYPAAAINQAHQLAARLGQDMKQLGQISRISVASATLTAPKQLEQILLSRNPAAIASVGESYAAVYGDAIAPADAPGELRDLVDMSDAEAQAALKKAIEIDALAEIELATAEEINARIQSSAPGSAPILEAQAAAWVVRANAYTQSALAELVRLRSVELADSGARLKLSAADLARLRTGTNQALQHKTR